MFRIYMFYNLSQYKEYNIHLTPINHQENFIQHYVEFASGESAIIFNTKKITMIL